MTAPDEGPAIGSTGSSQPLSNAPKSSFGMAAYGGDGWSGRIRTHGEEIGGLWGACGIDSEWAPLEAVLLHRPGEELRAAEGDHNAVQMLEPIDMAGIQANHDAMAQTYCDLGVDVHLVEPAVVPPPNQMFCADVFAMTPQGAILARPASTVRAGEERWVARRLADIGVPILKTLTGNATFEGADLMWLDAKTALIGRGLRTNQTAIDQISGTLAEIGVETHAFDLPFGTMHFMGMLRFTDKDQVVAWPRRTPHAAVTLVRERGYEVAFLPQGEVIEEAEHNSAFNFVTLGPRKALMVGNNPASRAFYKSLGIECVEAPMAELRKAAGAVGCLTGIVRRQALHSPP